MRDLITFTQALADETRWRLLRLLFDDPLCVCELADILGMPQSSVSSHLQILRLADLLESERRGKWIYYRVARARRPLLSRLTTAFAAGPGQDRTLAGDAARARKRLASRDRSCCPLPRKSAASKIPQSSTPP